MLTGLKVLVIDGHASTGLALEETLKQFKCSAASARSATEGANLLRAASLKKTPFDVVLLEQRIPQGEAVVQAIRKCGPPQPLLVGLGPVDARGDPALVRGYVGKPVRRGALVQTVCRVHQESKRSSAREKEEVFSPPHERRRVSTAWATDSGASILVVEDNDVNRQVLSSFLRLKKYIVTEAVNGADGLEKLGAAAVDLVLLDIHMPILDGVAVMQIMKRRGLTAPVVVVTADDTIENRIKCEEAGAVRVLLKPVNLKELGEVIVKTLTEPAAPQQQQQQQQPGAACLIADRVETNRIFAGHAVQKIYRQRGGMRVMHAATGPEAVELAARHKFEFVLLDLKMPELNGLEVAKRIRALDPGVTICGVAGSEGGEEARRQGREAGMDTVLFKPLRLEELARALEKKNQKQGAGGGGDDDAEKHVFDESFLEDADAEFRRSLLTGWKASLEEMACQMRLQAEERDWAGLERSAHAAKGAAAQIGARAISSVARDIEFEAKRGDASYEKVRKLMTELETVQKQTLEYLQM